MTAFGIDRRGSRVSAPAVATTCTLLYAKAAAMRVFHPSEESSRRACSELWDDGLRTSVSPDYNPLARSTSYGLFQYLNPNLSWPETPPRSSINPPRIRPRIKAIYPECGQILAGCKKREGSAHLEQREEILCLAIPPHRTEVGDDDGEPENCDPDGRSEGGVPEADKGCCGRLPRTLITLRLRSDGRR